MSKAICTTCQKPKATLQCALCQQDLCKGCTLFLEDDSVAYLTDKSPELTPSAFCGTCYDTRVMPALHRYDETLIKAKQVSVFFKTQGKETRLLKRSKVVYKVQNCLDRDEALLRLAYFAANEGFNTLIDVELVSEKVRINSYQTLSWSGQGTPSQLSDRR